MTNESRLIFTHAKLRTRIAGVLVRLFRNRLFLCGSSALEQTGCGRARVSGRGGNIRRTGGIAIYSLILLLFLPGCAQTRLYEGGRLLAVIQGDAVNITIKGRYTEFHADTLKHSTATRAMGTAIAKITATLGGLAGAIGTAVTGNAIPLAPAIAVPVVDAVTQPKNP